jgi:acyl carrier protein
MGLDLLDLVFRIERTFRVKLPTDEVVGPRLARKRPADGKPPPGEDATDNALPYPAGTVGRLYFIILEQLSRYERPCCLGGRVFYRMRRALAEVFGTPWEDVTPASRLEEVLPLRQRRENWQRLAEALDLPLPPLVRPVRLELALHLSGSACLLAGVLAALLTAAGRGPGSVWIVLGLLAFNVLKSRLAWFLTRSWAVCFPPSCPTVKGLIRTLLRTEYGQIVEQERAWHQLEVWYALQAILVETLEVAPETVTLEAHLARDLGAG